jgi:hypothetical protein
MMQPQLSKVKCCKGEHSVFTVHTHRFHSILLLSRWLATTGSIETDAQTSVCSDPGDPLSVIFYSVTRQRPSGLVTSPRSLVSSLYGYADTLSFFFSFFFSFFEENADTLSPILFLFYLFI